MIRNTLPSNTIFNLHIKINKYKRRGLKLQKENSKLKDELRADEILMSKLAKENKELLKVVYA